MGVSSRMFADLCGSTRRSGMQRTEDYFNSKNDDHHFENAWRREREAFDDGVRNSAHTAFEAAHPSMRADELAGELVVEEAARALLKKRDEAWQQAMLEQKLEQKAADDERAKTRQAERDMWDIRREQHAIIRHESAARMFQADDERRRREGLALKGRLFLRRWRHRVCPAVRAQRKRDFAAAMADGFIGQ